MTKKTRFIPARYGDRECDILDGLQQRTGLTASELLRRCVRLMGREKDRNPNLSFLLELGGN